MGEDEKPEPLTFEAIVLWLESVWLDPEVRKGLDEKAWLRFVESLEEYLKTRLDDYVWPIE